MKKVVKVIRWAALALLLLVLSLGYKILGAKKKLDHGSATLLHSLPQARADVVGPGPGPGDGPGDGPGPGPDDS